MPLAAREQLELGLTIAVTLFVVAASPPSARNASDAFLIAGVFMLQIVYPTPFVRFAAPSSSSSLPSTSCVRADASCVRYCEGASPEARPGLAAASCPRPASCTAPVRRRFIQVPTFGLASAMWARRSLPRPGEGAPRWRSK